MRAWSMVTVQVVGVGFEAHPVQPVKALLSGVLAVSVTRVPLLKVALQVAALQFTPPTLDVTEPGPVAVTFKGKVGTKLAVTLRAWSMVTVQVVGVGFEAHPVQPVKALPGCGVAVSVTRVPWLNVSLQLAPGQLIEPGLEVIVPEPVVETVSG